ncbi:MAG: 50S ribosomal protein L18 [Aureliella sp.]
MRLKKVINNQRKRRTFRVRKKARGDAQRPRLCVNRTLQHFSCQLIDDEKGATLASASTKSSGIAPGGNCEAAKKVGELIAEKANAAGIKAVRLDRGSCRYHGRVAAFADAVRAGGIEL